MSAKRRPTIRDRSARLLALLILVLAAACGGDGDGVGEPEAQPAPDDATFGEGDFADVPLPPLAEPAGERSERDGVVAQSFFVRNRTPEEVLSFYADYFEAEDVEEIDAPEADRDAWRGTWLLDDRELLVSAIPAPTAEGDEVEQSDVVSQMSLELAPADGGGHDSSATAP